jgi:putative ABC transport system ATP-binding protein
MVAAIACNNLTKVYGRGSLAEIAIQNVSLSFAAGETCIMLGPSGSGKTTLLSILGCLLSPTSGTVQIDGQAVNYSSPGKLTRLRRTSIGFVFQHAQLLPFLSVRQNLSVVAQNAAMSSRHAADRIALLLDRLGIDKNSHRKPHELSGGQRQRVAIARATLHRPRIILADEPTAALDWTNGQIAMKLLVEQAKADKALLITVTHDTRLTNLFDRVIHLESGKVCRA